MTRLEEDDYLTIQLLSYNNLNELTEEYYFLEMSTLQLTTLLFQGLTIITSEIVAHTDDDKYLDRSFTTIGEFNEFFLKNPDYYIHNCEIKLENGTTINSHDDGEVSVKFSIDNVDDVLLDNIFKKHNLNKSLIGQLKKSPGHYFAVDKNGNIMADYETFDEYLKNGKS